MNRLIRQLAFAAIGFAFASMLREWSSKAGGRGHHRMLETWENEGGALPESPSTGSDGNRRAAA